MSQDENIVWHAQTVSRDKKQQHKGHKPVLLWYTGLSGSGKSTVANAVEAKLFSLGCHTYLLDGDNVRMGLNKGLTFSDEDRIENIRRISEVAKLFVDAGLIVSTAFISPFKADRAQARNIVNEGEFVEVFIDTPLAVCESRDPKGLYKKARAGEIPNFTGISSAFDVPENPDIHVKTAEQTIEQCAAQIVDYLINNKIVNAKS
ncbi:adenylyl-sulfate kinase [Pseudoalteromonas sp. CST5]|uniref:adenylyl-sulfate kinase n=1 Tax=unclassified Pseudoalteromonas TaxID=194690 RepID=UPI002358D63E|nr:MULTISPECIES: adenylyl-sulfate kinase [unclassified Pseudoalteromonas]MDC9513025.1 adenylyl-sulfate kinase [Pseudoalteromonas sp. CST1]MDC9537238.1 adenylyl-sulfate kinase [Pseudoalteromonas sp. CST3]MDC9541552.1 adenylyl-sulfate kinase [Pseudoalteromonas sp. CST2]MDC9544389.1 adenylyl-sulfate kinase [Pseudoalteromonas sp. CST4]MDC9548583.1 adenylyl-sulfate kinase [Pseudoalteromonas sp. CST5]